LEYQWIYERTIIAEVELPSPWVTTTDDAA
jgi:hypothetical protein